MAKGIKICGFRFLLTAILSINFFASAASISKGAELDVSDPSTYITETYNDTIGWGNPLIYPRAREYTFFCGADGNIEVTLLSAWLRYLGLSLLDAQGNIKTSRDLYNRGTPYTTSFWVSAGRYTIKVFDAGWGALAPSISYTISINHAQSAPQIELTSPANTAAVSHNVLVGAERKSIPYNPELDSLGILLGGNLIAILSSGPYQFSLSTDGLQNGWYDLEFRGYDNLGRYNSLISSLEIKNQDPDTETTSYKDRIGWGSSLLYPQILIYPFKMRREGYFNATISGDIYLRYFGWIVKDNTGQVRHYHDFYYDSTYVRRSLYLEKGSYTLQVFDCGFYPLAPYVSYILTLDYPYQGEVFKDVQIERTSFDPSEDNQGTSLETTEVSYETTEAAYINAVVKGKDGTSMRTLLSNSYQEPTEYAFSWDGKDSQGRIAEEGEFSIVLEARDSEGILLDTASVEAEVLYHMGY